MVLIANFENILKAESNQYIFYELLADEVRTIGI
jgi:hypothetical protein